LRVIGLTGGIACGKSTVSAWLKQQPGCRVIDADQLSRALTVPGGKAIPEIRRYFGNSVFLSDGSLNRKKLGNLIFSDPDSRQQLDEIMAPLLKNLTSEAIERARSENVSLVILDYPLLFEKGYDSLCDSVWCVYLPESLQIQRLMTRDQISEDDAVKRISSQMPTDEKASRSQVVIDNSGSVEYTLSMLPSLLDKELTAASPRSRKRRSDHYRSDAPSDQPAQANWQLEAQRNQPSSASPVPDTFERSPNAKRHPTERKAKWLMPSWLIALNTFFLIALLCGIVAQILMRGYLTHQQNIHETEAQAILAQFPLEYEDFIDSTAREYNLRPAFVAAIIRNESSFQPRAESSVGARGLMQLMPDTAEWIAGKLKISGYAFDRMYDPESNIQFGCWYLNYLSNLFHGDPVCVACAYHAGQGQVTTWLSDPLLSDDGVTLNIENMTDGPTKTYARRVTRAYGVYQALYYNNDSDSASDADLSGVSQ